MEAEEIIERFKLIKSPTEGGYYREVQKILDDNGNVLANDSYYLLRADEICRLHLVKRSTELYSFYGGDPVEMIQVDPEGHVQRWVLGRNLAGGEVVKVNVPAGVWQGLKLRPAGKWCLLGITCVPGFEADDYQRGSVEAIKNLFPEQFEILRPFLES